MSRVTVEELSIDRELRDFVDNEVLPGLAISSEHIWASLRSIATEIGPEIRSALQKRDELQALIDVWYSQGDGKTATVSAQRLFLEEIGYLVPEAESFKISTSNVDTEISTIAGPQLVVPVNNARFALNAVNARWGSLYDALYGTNVIPQIGDCEVGAEYNPIRGQRVVEHAAKFLDSAAPLSSGSHGDVVEYCTERSDGSFDFFVKMHDGSTSHLCDPDQFVAFDENEGGLTSLVLINNQLHIEIAIDRNHPIGELSASGVKDVRLESAISTIMDCEDSVAAVDAFDKVAVYRNWLGLMKGDLEESFHKNGEAVTRKMHPDRNFIAPTGEHISLPSRSLMLVRNVGHLMTTDAVLDEHGQELSEGILDALITSLCALHDISGEGEMRNSRSGSIYIVKPKLHGPEEVAVTERLFSRIEDALSLARNTIKIGVMDEERRTTVNLKECIRQVAARIAFINTGFLDRTGDEIHTCFNGGAIVPKEHVKSAPWIAAYEDWNVDVGLECGFRGRAQIGKGMWPKPDEMAEMIETKQAHLEAGANCAWVPSPTAATLHALHYHAFNVANRQLELSRRKKADLNNILIPPIADASPLTQESIEAELENNIQGILGYVVRWIDQGIGCSKVPDIANVGLMEDRATLRISSQHIANWLHHSVCTEDQVHAILRRMARVVDRQNRHDPAYQSMSSNIDGNFAYRAACDLIFRGASQPNGYTEPTLHSLRRLAKQHNQVTKV